MVGAKNAHRERQVESCGMEVLLFGQVLAMKSAGYIFCDSFIHILIAYMHQRLTDNTRMTCPNTCIRAPQCQT